jgi:hypothetical protein
VARRRATGTWDGALTAWATAWIIAGVVLGFQIWQLTGLARTTISSGQQISQAGASLESLARTPIIGEAVADVGRQISATGQGLVENGTRAERSVRAMSLLVGLAVALVPTAPLVAVQLPIMRARRRDRDAIRAALAREGLTPALETVLAGRAAVALPVSQVLAMSTEQDPAARRHDLALAELGRLGVALRKGE